MKKSGYKNAYHRLVTKENLEKIKHILNEHGYYDKITVDRIEYEKKDNLPYNLAQYIAKLRLAYISRFSERETELSEYIYMGAEHTV